MKYDYTRPLSRAEVEAFSDKEVDVYADHLEHSLFMIEYGGTTIEKIVKWYALIPHDGMYLVPRWGWAVVNEDGVWKLYY